jgi:hypothetical protein
MCTDEENGDAGNWNMNVATPRTNNELSAMLALK